MGGEEGLAVCIKINGEKTEVEEMTPEIAMILIECYVDPWVGEGP
jgi:hypothetical protein